MSGGNEKGVYHRLFLPKWLLSLGRAPRARRGLDDKLHPVLSGRYPTLRILVELKKSHKDRLLPMAPEVANLLESMFESKRNGPSFKLGQNDGKLGRSATERVSKTVTNRRYPRLDASRMPTLGAEPIPSLNSR